MKEKKTFRINPGSKKTFEIKNGRTYRDDELILNVEPIEEGSYTPENEGHLEILVEYPLLDAAKKFYKKGIKTFMSSANKRHDEAYLILYYDSLSDENKKIAELFEIYEHGSDKLLRFVKIGMSINKKTTVGEVREKFNEIADKFKDQTK